MCIKAIPFAQGHFLVLDGNKINQIFLNNFPKKKTEKMSGQKKHHLTIKQKKDIISFCDENLGISTRKVAKHFGSKFGRSINFSTITKMLRRRDDIIRTPQKGLSNVRVKSTLEQEFELELVETMNLTYQRANLTADIGQRLAQQIQNKPMYADSKVVQDFRFCHTWWSHFCKRHGWGYNRIRGNMKIFPSDEIEAEQLRLRKLTENYSDENCWNCDESAIFPNAVGKMSWQPRELNGRDLKNEKTRITCTSYIARDGTVPFPP